MKLKFIEMCGFRGYRKPIRLEFGESFTVVDGRNGVGKSTIFDAVEFALTGELSKYNDAKASGQTVADYIWWTGEGDSPEDRYVEAGFYDDDSEFIIRRTQFGQPDSGDLEKLTTRLCDRALSPSAPLTQLCASTIIRDEHITSLSLDLKEAERYALLRDALGANDAESWIARGAKLVSLAKARLATAQNEVTVANAEVATSGRRLDEVRARIVAETTVGEAADRLRTFARTAATADQLLSPVRERISAVTSEIEALNGLVGRWNTIEDERSQLPVLTATIEAANKEKDSASAELKSALSTLAALKSSASLNDEARTLLTLVAVGRKLGLRNGHCPLCEADRSHDDFERALASVEALAGRVDSDAANAMRVEREKTNAESRIANAERTAATAATRQAQVRSSVQAFDEQLRAFGVQPGAKASEVSKRADDLRLTVEAAQKDLRIIETLRLNSELERAQRSESDAANRLARAQERFGRARKAEAAAQALYDAARRASSETLDRRLERVLPLLSEIYRRLRPHPVWSDIEYSIRGDVRRFMTLRVGEELNPQFLFSSGQRRATGLAFLLAVNLSLAWSRWRTILLDDPVQHVDDFRTVHLAEVAAQLVADGRQVICAVEDAALADLLCRRLPIGRGGAARRITLGPDSDGALAIVSERDLQPLPSSTMVANSEQRVAG